MEGLVNYSSEDEQDEFAYSKVAVRERGSDGAEIPGRTATDSKVAVKRFYEHSKNSCEGEAHKYRDVGHERFKSGHTNHTEDKYKMDKRLDKSKDQREKRESRELRSNRDGRDDYDSSQKYDYKKLEDQKRYKEQRRDNKRDGNDYYKDDKKYNRYDDKKTPYNTNKDRLSTSKTRYDDRKKHNDRYNDDRRVINEERRSSSGFYSDDRRKEFTDRRGYNNEDDRKADRRNDERGPQRSYNEDRSNTYRRGRSNSPLLSSHHNKSNNKYSERREDNAKRERKRHSRSRSRSRSSPADNSSESKLSLTSSEHQRTLSSKHLGDTQHPETEVEPHKSEKKFLPTARNFEALLTLPLSENTPKNPNVGTVSTLSAAAGLSTTTAAVQLPSYYNPNVINPNKYVEQMQKRKLILGAKKSEDSASKWGHAQFSQDQDGKVASKFMRLMGIKTATGTGGDSSTVPSETEKKSPLTANPPSSTDVKSREAMFSTMEQQYEVARQVTHTMRGVGLGFSSQPRPY